jgi:hypothetical protein
MGRFPKISDGGDSVRLEDEGMACIAAAAVASADRPVAMTRCCGGGFAGVHLHFRRFLQLQGFRSESTVSKLSSWSRLIGIYGPVCLSSSGWEVDWDNTSLSPFGRAGTIGINLLASGVA